MKIFKILVKNFDEHNAKAIGKTLPWFRCESRLARSSKFLHLSSGAKHMWLWLLCEAAQSSNRVVYVSARDVSKEVHVKPQNIPGVFSELLALEWIQVLESGKPLYETRRTRRDETENTNERKTPPVSGDPPDQIALLVEDAPAPKPEPQFDFESLYAVFPRHEGKPAGMKSAVEQVGKSAETFAQLKAAVEHYAALVKKRKTEPQFVKLWSSFVGTKRSGYPWREYVLRPAELDRQKSGDNTSEAYLRPEGYFATDGFDFRSDDTGGQDE